MSKFLSAIFVCLFSVALMTGCCGGGNCCNSKCKVKCCEDCKCGKKECPNCHDCCNK